MSQETSQIKCPECGEEIDVNEILYHKLDNELKHKYQEENAIERKRYAKKEAKLKSEIIAVEKQNSEYEEKLSEGIRSGLKEETAKIEKSIKKNLEEEQADRFKLMEDELNEKSNQVKELNKTKADLVKVEREKSELKDKIELEFQQKLTVQMAGEKEKIQKDEADKSQFKISEKEEVIKQLHEQLSIAQRKAEQGSMQTQGEVQELAIEEWLDEQFPLDFIQEIKKGERGADCLHHIHTRTRQNCGTVYYESKRTKTFNLGWIDKFKGDMREKNADIGVLVTQNMPTDMERLGLKDGVWVCTFEEFKGLSIVLRESIIKISNAIVTQDNKGDKMGMLYDFLTSNEFKSQIEAIVEGFTQMKVDLESEQRSMRSIWKKREKQIDKVLFNTTDMYGSIKGIAGNAIQTISLLELSTDDEIETKE